jgi:hypothetical protein
MRAAAAPSYLSRTHREGGVCDQHPLGYQQQQQHQLLLMDEKNG